jgi:hypothetical protein
LDVGGGYLYPFHLDVQEVVCLTGLSIGIELKQRSGCTVMHPLLCYMV